MPGLHKEGYEEAPNTTARDEVADERAEGHARRNQRQDPLRNPGDGGLPEPARPYPFQDPLAAPRRPIPQGDFPPPGFDDELDMNRPLRGMAPPFPGAGSPFGIGHDDLNPPGLGPHDPLRGSFVGGGGGGFGGGMHPTFDDPLFRGQGGREQDPRAPPGARFDDPFGPPGNGPRGGGMGGRPPNPFGGFGGGDYI